MDEMLKSPDLLSENDWEWVKKIDSTVADCQHQNFTTRQYHVIMDIYEKFTGRKKCNTITEKRPVKESSKLEIKDLELNSKVDGVCLNFTSDEISMLKRYLDFYKSLDEGVRVPTTPAQHNFVRVCKGLETPETDHELLYLSFREDKKTFVRFMNNHTEEFEHDNPQTNVAKSPNLIKSIANHNTAIAKKRSSNKSVHSRKDQDKLDRIKLGRMNQGMRRIRDAMAVGSD